MLRGHENGKTSGKVAYSRDDSGPGVYLMTWVFKYDVIVQNVLMFPDACVKYGQVAADDEMPCNVPGYEIDFQSPNAISRPYKLIVIPFSPDEWPYFLIWNGNDHNEYQPGCMQKRNHRHIRVVDLSVFLSDAV